jgi:hypothetical protein
VAHRKLLKVGGCRADTRPVQTEEAIARVPSSSLGVAEYLEDRWEAEWLASALQEAATWGAERFAAEFHRRDIEERRLRESEARAFGHGDETGPDGAPTAEPVMWGPVASEVAEHVVGVDRGGLDLHRPIRHPFVPRPPALEPERGRGRRKRDREVPEPASTITAQQAARMSPAARRLYGLDERPDRRGR